MNGHVGMFRSKVFGQFLCHALGDFINKKSPYRMKKLAKMIGVHFTNQLF
jgi:hypothetical protein